MAITRLLSRLIRGCTIGILLIGVGRGVTADDTDEKAKPSASFRAYKKLVLALAFTPDGKTLATAGNGSTDEVVFWDMKTTPAPDHGEGIPGRLYALEFSPDGKLLAGGGSTAIASNSNGLSLPEARAVIWDAVTGKELFALEGHSGSVIGLAFSADGKTLATADSDGAVKIWETRTGKQRANLRGDEVAVQAVAFAPDGKTLATTCADRTVKIWSLASGKVQTTLKGHQAPVLTVGFAPDGKTLVTGGGYGGDDTGELKLWDVVTGKEKGTLPGHQESFAAVAFSPDGKTFASGSRGGTIKLWDANTTREKWSQQAVLNLRLVRFSSDGKVLATAGDQLRLWYTVTGKEKLSPEAEAERERREAEEQRLQAEVERARQERTRKWREQEARLTPEQRAKFDELQALVRRQQYNLSLRQAQEAMERWEFTRARELLDGLRPAEGQEDLRGFEYHCLRGQEPTERLLTGHTGKVHAAIFSPDGRTLATVSADRTVKLWDTRTGKERATLKGHKEGITCLRFGANGKLIVTGDAGQTVRIWDAETGKEKAVLGTKKLKWKQNRESDDNAIAAAVVTPDGKYVAAVCPWEMKVIEVGTGQAKFGVELKLSWGYWDDFYKECMYCPVFSPDGKVLVLSTNRIVRDQPGGSSGRSIGQIRSWDVATGKERPMMEYSDSESGKIVFSADGQTLITLARLGRELRVWDVAHAREKATLEHGDNVIIRGFVLSPDGRTVATAAGGQLGFWDTATGKRKGRAWDGGDCLAFSPRANLLVAGGMRDKEHFGLILCDPETGKELARSDKLLGELAAVAFVSNNVVAAVSVKENQVALLSLRVEQLPLKIFDFEKGVGVLAFSPDGKSLLAGGNGEEENNLCVWDLSMGRERESLRRTQARPYSIAFAPNGKTVATASHGFQGVSITPA